MNTPNKLTLLRMLLVPVFIGCFYLPGAYSELVAAVVFFLAYLTDVFDGRLARKYNIITNFGKLMDPVADKMLTCAALIMLVSMQRVSPVATILILAREFLISGFRLVAVQDGNVIAASKLGKLKTVSQCVAILLVLLWPYTHSAFALDQLVLWVSVAITVWSGVEYLVKNKGNISLK